MLAISSTVQKRPIGMRRRRPSMNSCVISLKRSVSVMAGARELTVTPLSVSSLARLLVSAITPAFAAEYAELFGLPSLPAIEAMLTMRP